MIYNIRGYYLKANALDRCSRIRFFLIRGLFLFLSILIALAPHTHVSIRQSFLYVHGFFFLDGIRARVRMGYDRKDHPMTGRASPTSEPVF